MLTQSLVIFFHFFSFFFIYSYLSLLISSHSFFTVLGWSHLFVFILLYFILFYSYLFWIFSFTFIFSHFFSFLFIFFDLLLFFPINFVTCCLYTFISISSLYMYFLFFCPNLFTLLQIFCNYGHLFWKKMDPHGPISVSSSMVKR